MNVNSRIMVYVFAGLLTAAISGCSGKSDRPKTVAVQGQVIYNNKPVEGAYVSFWAEDAPRAAEGTTDKDGKFSLSMFELNDGAMAGENKVAVSKPEANTASGTADSPGGAPKPEDMMKSYMARKNSKTLATKSVIPGKYATRESTPLKVEVKSGSNEPFMIQLTD